MTLHSLFFLFKRINKILRSANALEDFFLKLFFIIIHNKNMLLYY